MDVVGETGHVGQVDQGQTGWELGPGERVPIGGRGAQFCTEE